MSQGVYIEIEGCDDSGKTTQARRLAEALEFEARPSARRVSFAARLLAAVRPLLGGPS